MEEAKCKNELTRWKMLYNRIRLFIDVSKIYFVRTHTNYTYIPSIWWVWFSPIQFPHHHIFSFLCQLIHIFERKISNLRWNASHFFLSFYANALIHTYRNESMIMVMLAIFIISLDIILLFHFISFHFILFHFISLFI